MTVFALAFLIGLFNGLRSFSPPAAVAWSAHLHWIKLEGPMALIGSVPAVVIFTILTAFELFADKQPWIPARITAMSLILRGVMGALTGACVSFAGGMWADIGAAFGVAGGIAGAFAGYQARMRSAKALSVPDFYIALVEDLICVAGALFVVTRFR